MTENTNEPTTTTLVLLLALKAVAELANENFKSLPIASVPPTSAEITSSYIEEVIKHFHSLETSQYNRLVEDIRRIDERRFNWSLPEYMSEIVNEASDDD